MSNLLNSFYSNLNDLVSINATDITTDSLYTTTLTINGVVFNLSILDNYVLITTFNNTLLNYVTTSQLNTALSSYATFNDLQITNSDVADLQFILTGASYNSTYNFLDLTNNVHIFGTLMLGDPQVDIGNFILNTIPSTYATISSLSNYVNKSSNESIDGIKTFNSAPIMSGLNITSNTIPVTSVVGQALSLSAIQTVTATKTWSAQQIFTNNIRLDTGSLVLASNTITITNATLQKLVYLDVTSSIATQFTSITNKLTNISFVSPKTTISGDLEFTGTFNGLSTNMVKSLQDMSGNILARFIVDEGLIASNGVTLAGVVIDLGITNGIVTGHTGDITALKDADTTIKGRCTALEFKTTNQSYSIATSRTSFSSTTNIDNLEIGNLVSGLTQTINSQVKLIGVLRLENQLTIASGFGIGVEGGIVQSLVGSSNSFAGPVSMSNILTLTGSETNIKTTNLYISSNTIIKNTSTISSGVVSPYLSVLSTSSNNNARKLQGIVIGKEQVLNNQSNCNIGYNYLSDGSSGNYGYLGLNVNTLNTIESLRWFSTGVAVPVGDLTISSGNAIVTTGNLQISTGSLNTNTINNQSTNLTINSTNNLSLNSNTINIGANQAVGALNNINVGALTSLSNINLNGIVYAPLGLNMTGVGSIFAQW